ncbi:MAG: biotin transporter BioY [Pseudomonadota bacterium]
MTSNAALAPRAISDKSYSYGMYALLVVFGISLIAISAKIQIPFWPVPMTLQTMAIAGIAAAYGLRLGLATIVAYLAAGFLGAPVFAGMIAGPAYFVGPTAGFLAGFIVLTVIVGFVADRVSSQSFWKLLGAMLVGDALLFTLGFIWLGYFFVTGSGNTLGSAFAWEKGVQPYILADLFKMVLAAAAIPAISALMKR